jgi:hypothetical protein
VLAASLLAAVAAAEVTASGDGFFEQSHRQLVSTDRLLTYLPEHGVG